MFKGFEPVYDSRSQILILGSFPSVKSREVGFYYGNKQNRFWRMLEGVFEEKIGDSIDEKKVFLYKHGIALYDVVVESDLSGSADLSLEKSKFLQADISFLLPPFTKVAAILCNGKTAFNILSKSYCGKVPIALLSSTSSANPKYNFAEWKKAILKLIPQNSGSTHTK